MVWTAPVKRIKTFELPGHHMRRGFYLHGGMMDNNLSNTIDTITWMIEIARYEYVKQLLRQWLDFYERMIP